MSKVRKDDPGDGTPSQRDRILQAALEVFAEKGFTNGTLQNIGDIVGMTRAGVLHYFGSKDNLLIQVLKYRDSQEVESRPGKTMPKGMGCLHQLMYTTYLNAHRRGLVRAFTMFSSESIAEDNPGNAFFRERYHNLRIEVADALRQIVAERRQMQGEQMTLEDERRAKFAAESMLAVMDGVQLQWLMDEEDAPELVEPIEFALTAMLAAMLNPPGDLLGGGFVMTIRKQATIRDVAKMAGVAVSTASRALGNGPASKATREKVEHAAKQLQFVPNPTARRLSEGTSDIVALVVQETPSFIFGDPNIAEMVGSLSVNLTREGLIPFLSLANPKDADGFGRLLRETGADAAVAISSHMGDALLRVVGESDVPWVFIGKPPKGLRCPYVDVDQKRAGYDVGRLLVERGRRHMAVISGPFDMSAPQGRNQGFEQALAEDGLKPEVVMEADFSVEGGFGGMIRVIRNHPEVDAVFAHSDQMAAGALRYLLQAGRKVPQDVSLVGFDDLRIARALSPSLTTCAQPIEQLSSAVVDLLKRSLGSEKRVRDSAIFRAPLVLRESV